VNVTIVLCRPSTHYFFPAANRPFRVIFKTDANEVTIAAGAAAMANNNEQAAGAAAPAIAGIVGFSLNYQQVSC